MVSADLLTHRSTNPQFAGNPAATSGPLTIELVISAPSPAPACGNELTFAADEREARSGGAGILIAAGAAHKRAMCRIARWLPAALGPYKWAPDLEKNVGLPGLAASVAETGGGQMSGIRGPYLREAGAHAVPAGAMGGSAACFEQTAKSALLAEVNIHT